MKSMKAKEVMTRYNICRHTLCRWVKFGLIEYEKIPSGRYNYGLKKNDIQASVITKQTVIYARVSTTSQKTNLVRQIDRLKDFASANGLIVDEVYSEVASALNYKRKKFNKLMNNIFDRKIKCVLMEYKDRLLRIGFVQFEEICKRFDVQIIVVDNSADDGKDKHKEIINDLVSIMHHFSAKIYSLRKNKKKIEQLIKC